MFFYSSAYCKNPVDGSWWSFDDTKVSPLSSSDNTKTASAYILFYHRRNTVLPQEMNPSPSMQHWCRGLLKKYHKISNSNSINGVVSSASKNDDEKLPACNGDSDKDSTCTREFNGNSDELDKNEDRSVSCNSAPLAKMEEMNGVGFNGTLCKDVQIESTV